MHYSSIIYTLSQTLPNTEKPREIHFSWGYYFQFSFGNPQGDPKDT